MSHVSRERLIEIAALGAVLLLASSAGAGVTYPLLYGVWSRGDGIDVDVPFVGKTVGNCDFILQGQNRDRPTGNFMTMWMNGSTVTNTAYHPAVYTGTVVTTTTTTTTMTGSGATNTNTNTHMFPRGFMVNAAANYGCLHGTTMSFYVVSNAEGATITIPTNLLSRPSLDKLVAVPIPGAPALVQAATDADWFVPHSMRVGADPRDGLAHPTQMFSFLTAGPTQRTPAGCNHRAPTTTAPATAPLACNNMPPLNRLKKDAWLSQSGRAGENFTWCPGLPGCITINQVGATDGMIVKYKAGPNKFGGTIAQIVETKEVGSLFVRLGEGGGVDVQQLDAGIGAIQATGRGYADFLTDYLMAATKGFTTVYVDKHFKSTLDTSVTLITAVGATQAPVFPAGTNQKWGFPLTTGTVVVRNTNAPAVGDPVVTITGMGYDKLMPRTPTSGGGSVPTPSAMSRNISLVAGAVANLAPIINVNTSAMGQLFLPEPDRSGQLLAGALALMAIAAWRARAQRR